MTASKLTSVLYYTRNIIGSDNSVRSTDVWQTDTPLAVTVQDFDSDTGRRIAEAHLGGGANATVTAQLVALASVTSPSLRLDRYAPNRHAEPHIILDGNTWRRAGETLNRIYQALAWAPRVTFSYRNSNNTPGIQIADIVAYARRRRLLDGDCTEAAKVIDELRL